MDLVFSERGPMGRQDVTLIEALRVLRPGGLILVETIGELNSWQTAAAFTDSGAKPATALKVLGTECERFERLGVSIQVLASRIETIQFPDIYEWLTSQCYTWNEPRREKLDALTPAYFERFAEIAGDAQGRINVTRHTVWIGGAKQ